MTDEYTVELQYNDTLPDISTAYIVPSYICDTYSVESAPTHKPTTIINVPYGTNVVTLPLISILRMIHPVETPAEYP